jgi:hypothetical protein
VSEGVPSAKAKGNVASIVGPGCREAVRARGVEEAFGAELLGVVIDGGIAS